MAGNQPQQERGRERGRVENESDWRLAPHAANINAASLIVPGFSLAGTTASFFDDHPGTGPRFPRVAPPSSHFRGRNNDFFLPFAFLLRSPRISSGPLINGGDSSAAKVPSELRYPGTRTAGLWRFNCTPVREVSIVIDGGGSFADLDDLFHPLHRVAGWRFGRVSKRGVSVPGREEGVPLCADDT